MFILSVSIFSLLSIVAAACYVEYEVVDDLPEDNKFKRWWRKHIIPTHL